MIRKLLAAAAAMAVALSATAAVLYVSNAAPAVPTLSAAESAAPTKPFVIKLHARWCPDCMLTKETSGRASSRPTPARVNFVVLDATNEAAVERSRLEAERFNLRQFFDDYNGATGLVVVLDGRTKEVLAEIGGNASFEEFRSAIDPALARQVLTPENQTELAPQGTKGSRRIALGAISLHVCSPPERKTA